MDIDRLLKRYRIEEARGFRLRKHDPADEGGLTLEREEAEALLAAGQRHLAEMQDKLYAQNRWAVLCIVQAMDAAGKDGTIKHVFSGLNPQGCEVTPFKAPTSLELDHDFLWRHVAALPRRGHIGIHNRSWYEEVLVARIHPEIIQRQRLPKGLVGKRLYDERLEDIAGFERYLARNGVLVLKFFLHVSRDEQRRRFLARIDDPSKNWKFNAADVAEREHWDAYQDAYERAIRATAAPHAPWFVVPADRKWFCRLVVSGAIVQALEGLALHYPLLSAAEMAGLQQARTALVS
jgi:PPK2 family polyphosphate:nucleotide phosphotransferase